MEAAAQSPSGGLPGFLVILLVLGAMFGLALLLRRLLGRTWLYHTIFEAETPAGRSFDLILLAAIVLSVAAVLLESDPVLRVDWAGSFEILEWTFTLIFTLEYLLRLLCVARPVRYALSFFGLVDLLSIVPSFLGLLVTGAQVFLVVRVLRLMRIFRVLKLAEYLQESQLLWGALAASRRKISVFLLSMVTLVLIIGSLMYVIEGPDRGFRSIPVGIYWAIVTITTVGYGDVAPVTPLGRFVASAVMLLGYSIIAVPTGIITSEINAASERRRTGPPPTTIVCHACQREGHDGDAQHCKYCGAGL
jgi:voltage-gated potassium channel